MRALQTLLPNSHEVMQFGNEDVEDKLDNDFQKSWFSKRDGYPDYELLTRVMEELLKGLLWNTKSPLKGCENWLLRRADRESNITPDSSATPDKSRFACLLQYFRCLAQISVQEDSTVLGSFIAMMWQKVYRRIYEHEDRRFVLEWWRTLEWATMNPEDVHGTILTL